jgi:DNA-binding IclR family transcriptional regulator
MKADPNGIAILEWMEQNADADGFITIRSRDIAIIMGLPLSTVQHAFTRLDRKGLVFQLSERRYAITRLAVQASDTEVEVA